MILVDDRVGAKELAPHLPTAQVERLAFADAAVIPEDGPTAGVERKRIEDLMSCIDNGRFMSEQLPGLLSSYQRVYLLVEGPWTVDRDGRLVVRGACVFHGRPRGWRYSEVMKWLFSVEEGAGVRVHRTGDVRESAAWLTNLATEIGKPASKRKAFKAVYQPPFRGLTSPSTARRFARLLPGIGDEKSAVVASHFGGSIRRIANATPAEWQEVEGIGKTLAAKIDAVLEGK